eukprot:Gb_28781 [translate_table: standard]
MVKIEIMRVEPMPKPSPFSKKEIWFWTIIFLVSFILANLSPMDFGTRDRTCLPFLLATTYLRYIIRFGFSPSAKKLLYPIITCAMFVNLAALSFRTFIRVGFEPVLGAYLTKSSSNLGSGNILMGFHGSIIISFYFMFH